MNKLFLGLITLPFFAVELSSCSSLASMQMQHKQLSNGQAVTVDYNLAPTPDWKCHYISKSKSYNWSEMSSTARMEFSSGYKVLADKLIDQANTDKINTNYINMVIPQENTFSVSQGNMTTTTNLNAYEQAYGEYYLCKKINPNDNVGVTKSTDIGIGIG